MVGTDIYLNSYYNNIHRGIYVGTTIQIYMRKRVCYLSFCHIFVFDGMCIECICIHPFSDIIIFTSISHKSEIIQNIVKTNIMNHQLSNHAKINSESPYHKSSNISFKSHIFISRSLHSDLEVRS